MARNDEAQIYRQGDVWLYRIPEGDFVGNASVRIEEPDLDKGLILAEGEVTGHHHRIVEADRTRLHRSRNSSTRDVRYLRVSRSRRSSTAPVALVHEEHETIAIPPGHYEVRIQREYAPTERSRQSYVAD